MSGEQAEQSSRGLVGRVFSETGSNYLFWELGDHLVVLGNRKLVVCAAVTGIESEV